MESIKQKPAAPVSRSLPDFRNLGVLLRSLLLVNLLALATVVIAEADVRRLGGAVVAMAGHLEAPLFVCMLALYLIQPLLARLSWIAGALTVVVLATIVAGGFVQGLYAGAGVSPLRAMLWAAAVATIGLLYFDYRSRRYSPALTEARLLALTSRIRPHFLFNALNAVLGIIRTDARRAEQVLEEIADLFRVLMRDNRELVPLAEEIALCERYLDIEQLRLGDRLRVRWQIEECPGDAMVPPLMLQPLLENAVYHGVEPSGVPVEIGIRAVRRSGEIRIEVENPVVEGRLSHCGNRMALDNIRERLMLFFDLEAGLDIAETGGIYRVGIRLPYRRGTA